MKKRYKYTHYTLLAFIVIAAGAGIQIYRNFGDLPVGNRFVHLAYYRVC